MKTSRYNYFIPNQEKVIFFNGISKRFFEVGKKNSEIFQDIICNPNNYSEKYNKFIARMKNEGFILDNETNEMELIYKKYKEMKLSSQYMLMILPTYRCNLSCWYCIQEHQNENLSSESVKRIKLHIEKYLIENKITRFRISWFGGEPLLGYKQLVEISSFAQDFCKKNNIEFYCDLTTNSLLLTEKRIKELKELSFRLFQISIDGCEEQHNKVKKTKKNSGFDTALKNIVSIVKLIPNVSCALRINYSDENLEPEKIMNDINKRIPEEHHSKIQVIPRKVWQIEDSKINRKELSSLNKLIGESNFRSNNLSLGMCYVDYIHFNSIFPDGRVDKCDNEDLKNTKGFLDESGNIMWEEKHPFLEHHALSENSSCLKCKHLPFCWGPCPKRRDQMWKKEGKINCMFPEPDIAIQHQIINYCQSFLFSKLQS